MKQTINMGLQVLPSGDQKGTFELVDVAIEIIEESGVSYRVCPLETVMEGDYDTLMGVVKKVHQAVFAAGADKMMTYIKIESYADKGASIEEKMEKYNPS